MIKNQKLAQYAFLLVVATCTLFLFNIDVPRTSRMLRADLRAATAMQLHKKFMKVIPEDEAPIIGIITQGTTDMAYYDDYTMIAASYIKYVEAAGGKAVLVPYNADEEALGRIYENINGLLVPGGRMKLVLPSRDTKDTPNPKMQMSMIARAVKYFVNRSVKDFNEGKGYFPIFGICLGQEAIALALNEDVLQTMTKLDLEENTYVHGAGPFSKESMKRVKDSRLFASFTNEEIKAFEEKARFYYHHKYGITEQTYKDSRILSQFMQPLTMLQDKSNNKYITSYEVSNYPLFGVQFHPEKTSFEWHITTDRSHEAVSATRKLGVNFVNECRKNNHAVADKALIKSLGVYNYMIMGPKNGYSQLFYFSKDKVEAAFESQDIRDMLI